jgi:hypothetical protein
MFTENISIRHWSSTRSSFKFNSFIWEKKVGCIFMCVVALNQALCVYLCSIGCTQNGIYFSNMFWNVIAKLMIHSLDYCTKSTYTDILGNNIGLKVFMYESYGMEIQGKRYSYI